MPETHVSHNQFAYSVSEIAGAVKTVVEDNFGHVRVRGEISGWKGPHSSGHCYFRLKDDKAVLETICWRGTMSKISFRPEEGMEVICTGKITTYPGRSNYQLVIDSMEPAGIGALMMMLEKRKAMLAAEGLFDPQRKKPLPFMPQVIGVVTSPTGAVIRDILHRIRDRFPARVIVWPVAVQGEGAAEQIAAAIAGFNNPQYRHFIPQPDLLIVARGGGSLEDLWAFNEEIVVRAVAASRIPVISAVGHETDTTLIDYASDMRAPTPSAAAEMAVPVREEWRLTMHEYGTRLFAAMTRSLMHRQDMMQGLARAVTHPRRMLETATQRLDDWSERLSTALPLALGKREQMLSLLAARMQPRVLAQDIARHLQDIRRLQERMAPLALRLLEERVRALASAGGLLESLSPARVLERGFVLVRDMQGALVTRASALKPEPHTLVFADGSKRVMPAKE